MKLAFLMMLLVVGIYGNAFAGIGLSYDQITYRLGKDFKMKKLPLSDGRERYYGKATDEVTLLEIIGKKDDITEATLTAFMSKDAPEIADRQIEMILRFLVNTGPKWAGSVDWMGMAFPKILKTGGKESIVRGRKIITIEFNKELSSCVVRVTKK